MTEGHELPNTSARGIARVPRRRSRSIRLKNSINSEKNIIVVIITIINHY